MAAIVKRTCFGVHTLYSAHGRAVCDPNAIPNNVWLISWGEKQIGRAFYEAQARERLMEFEAAIAADKEGAN
jgi:hypothetical protein